MVEIPIWLFTAIIILLYIMLIYCVKVVLVAKFGKPKKHLPIINKHSNSNTHQDT
jgi:hypothetical protein